MPSETALILLGTGTPNAEPNRAGSAAAVVVDGVAYLVDAGPGVVRRAMAMAQQGWPALHPPRLKHLFFTHLHSDHTVGYPDLLLTPWVLGRPEALQVWGPLGTQAMTKHLIAAYQADIDERLHGLEPTQSLGYQAEVTEFAAEGLIFEDARVRVEAFPVQHGSWPAYGYRFTTSQRVIVISGDTAPCESLPRYAQHCDILLHEVYSVAGLSRRPQKWRTYHQAVHTSAHQLGQLAEQAQAKMVVLTHQLLWGQSPANLLAEVRTHYSGLVLYGQDLTVY